MNLDRPRAKTAITGIFALLATGAYINRALIIARFVDAGYADALAERYADALIAANTDIQHFSRWSVWGTDGIVVTYSFG